MPEAEQARGSNAYLHGLAVSLVFVRNLFRNVAVGMSRLKREVSPADLESEIDGLLSGLDDDRQKEVCEAVQLALLNRLLSYFLRTHKPYSFSFRRDGLFLLTLLQLKLRRASQLGTGQGSAARPSL